MNNFLKKLDYSSIQTFENDIMLFKILENNLSSLSKIENLKPELIIEICSKLYIMNVFDNNYQNTYLQYQVAKMIGSHNDLNYAKKFLFEEEMMKEIGCMGDSLPDNN